MTYPAQPYEKCAVVATIDPANNNNNTFNSDAIDMSKFHELLAVLLLGSVDNTINFKLQESDASGGTYSDITGKAITALGGSDDNKQAVINLKSNELSSGKRYVKMVLTVGSGTTNLSAAVALGMSPRIGPASDDDLADVTQVVT